MSHPIQVAVVGATGLVGQAVLDLLASRDFPASRVFAVDTQDHDGETVSFGNLELNVHPVDEFGFEVTPLAIFVAGSEISRQYVPLAREAGATVIDFSSAYRQDDEVPLLVPALNGSLVADLPESALIAVPNCTVTPLAIALKALAEHGLKRVTVSTYQSVSGSGQAALEELANQTTALFTQREAECEVYAKRIAYNLLPKIGDANESGATEEEASIVNELHRLFGSDELAVEATCVRVPVFFGHAWSVTVETDTEVEVSRARNLFASLGLHVVDQPQQADGYATPMEVAGNDRVWVSRVRRTGKTLSFWLTADNVRAAAAMSCVTVAEALQNAGHFG